jgi:methylmalonic aciduria homocystinuria type C protein
VPNALRESLAAAGFDIVHAFDPRVCGVPAIVDPARPLGLLVGNTRALWPHFTAAREPVPHPLDHYTEKMIGPLADRVFYAHREYDGAYLSFQRIAVAAGFGALSPSHLVIHPEYGPWFGLRAVILVEGVPPHRKPVTLSCACGTKCLTLFDRAMTTPRGPERLAAWIAVRDACPVGRAYRYSEEQIHHHYSFLM